MEEFWYNRGARYFYAVGFLSVWWYVKYKDVWVPGSTFAFSAYAFWPIAKYTVPSAKAGVVSILYDVASTYFQMSSPGGCVVVALRA